MLLIVEPLGQIREEYLRILILFILVSIKRHLYDVVVRNLRIPKIRSEQFKEQIGLPTSANTGNDLNQTVVTLGNQFAQVGVSANFHIHHPRLL